MTAKANPSSDAWTQRPADRTSQTDDARIKDITVLPPPEHLIRFFPIHGTPVESLITHTRKTIHNIMAGKDDRLLVVVGPCSIHDPAAAIDDRCTRECLAGAQRDGRRQRPAIEREVAAREVCPGIKLAERSVERRLRARGNAAGADHSVVGAGVPGLAGAFGSGVAGFVPASAEPALNIWIARSVSSRSDRKYGATVLSMIMS